MLNNTGRYIGRFTCMDADSGFGRRVGDTATMTHIGSLHGHHFSAERDGADLKLFSAHDEYGQPALREMAEQGTSGIRSSAGDAAPLSLAELNAMYAKSHAVGIRPRR
jgi:hypothetical protein